MLKTALEKETDKLLACVHCGLCLPSCPTYKQLGNENDSPRGRLYLMRAVAEGRAEPGEKYQKHIDLCLGCRACETACPSGVPYGSLLEVARAEISEEKAKKSLKDGLISFGLNKIFTHPKRLTLLFTLMKIVQKFPLSALILKSRLLKPIPSAEFALALLLQARSHLETVRKSISTEKRYTTVRKKQDRSVEQFTGCVMEGLFSQTNSATKRVLEVNGCKVTVTEGQVCCGALHAHAGFRQKAIELAKQNIDAFAPEGSRENSPIIVNAAGCGAMLKEYGELLSDDPKYAARAHSFSARVKDVMEYLAIVGIKTDNPVGLKVTYDAPCHLYHGQKVRKEPLDLIKSLPEIEFIPLQGAENCCGSAGIYNLTHPEMANRLLEEKLANIRKTGATLLVTGNPGCAMHLAAGLKLAGDKVIVIHPIELIDLTYSY